MRSLLTEERYILWVKLCFIHLCCCILQDEREDSFEEEEEEKEG
jgi:hypothetical protein